MTGKAFFVSKTGLVAAALVLAACGSPRQASQTSGEAPPAPAVSDEAFLEDLQARTFSWFWETTNPANGLVPDRAPDPPFSSVAAVGFGLTAYGVGVERGYVTREEAAERTLATLRFFRDAPQGPEPVGVAGRWGFFYHFLDMEDGTRFRDTELSTIDTALLMMGVLFAQEFYDRDTPEEREIRQLADALYRRVEWDRFQLPEGRISMGWKPDEGRFPYGYEGYDEAMFLYVLALGSPTHPVTPEAWDAFTSTYTWGDFYGYEHVNFGPLFGHQYSHVWIDFRGIQDAYMRERGLDYFENSRLATLSQRAYAIDNPGGFVGYGEDVWGLTASDGPANVRRVVSGDTVQFYTYRARAASLSGSQFEGVVDDGTIAPTATGGAIPFAPEVTVPALRAIRARYGDLVYNEYGFIDAFNPTFTFTDVEVERGVVDPERGWFTDQQLGIDQGPIVLMIENHRSGLVWEEMRENTYIVRGLCRAGFTGGWLDGRCE